MNSFNLFQGRAKIDCRKWLAPSPRASICLIHGLGEHKDRYDTTARFFCDMGFNVYALDLMGHGLSDGGRGNIGPRMAVLYTIDKLVSYAKKESEGLPVFIFGHSLGGNLALTYRLLMPHNKINGYIISAPWLLLSKVPSALKIFNVKCFSMLLPNRKINYKNVLEKTHINDVGEDYLKDDLIHPFISFQTFAVAHKNASIVLKNAKISSPPTMFFHGTNDHICDIEGSRRFCILSQNATLFEIEGAGHETMHRRDYFEILERAVSFINNNLTEYGE